MASPQDRRIRKFHVGTNQSDQEIIEQFVVRHKELEIALDTLSGNIAAASCQHLLIVAPRGRGKTTLAVRIIAEIRTNEAFSQHLFPVRLMEESQEIFCMADFWLESLFYIAKEVEREDPIFAGDLQATHNSLTGSWDDKNLEQQARAAVLDAADRLKKKLVIVLENMQTLSQEADADFGWQLRKALQAENQIMLLGTATSRFEGLDDAEQPYFELFRTICLKPLDVVECQALWRLISGDEANERDIMPLKILTGGSPRLMVVVAEFAHNRSIQQLMEQLVTLIDDHTEYFRSHLEALPPHERRVYLALIDLWQQSSTGEIAERARMEIRKVSAMLNRLVSRGAVVVEGSKKKRLYSAAERLYSIYYKLRRERDEAAVVKNLIRFMALFFSPSELSGLSSQLLTEAQHYPGIREGLNRAFTEFPDVKRLLDRTDHGTPPLSQFTAQTDGYDEKSAEFHALSEIKEAYRKGLFRQAAKQASLLVRSMRETPTTKTRRLLSEALLYEGNTQLKLGNVDAAIESYDEVVRRFGGRNEPALLEPVAKALFNRGVAQGQRGETDAAIESYDEVVRRFGDRKEKELWSTISIALANLAEALLGVGRVEEALETAKELHPHAQRAEEPISTLLSHHSKSIETLARFRLKDTNQGWKVLRSLYKSFDPENDMLLSNMQYKMIQLAAVGVSPKELFELLESDQRKAETLQPLIVALNQEAGIAVRAPGEVLDVATEIRKRIQEERGKLGR